MGNLQTNMNFAVGFGNIRILFPALTVIVNQFLACVSIPVVHGNVFGCTKTDYINHGTFVLCLGKDKNRFILIA